MAIWFGRYGRSTYAGLCCGVVVASWQFDVETAVATAEPGVWTSDVTADWNIASNPNGGYVLSSSLRAMSQLVGPDDVPLSVTAHYLRPAVGGVQATIEVEPAKQGRRLTVLRSVMSQPSVDDVGKPERAAKSRVTCLAAFGQINSENVDVRIDQLRPPSLPSPDACLDRSELPQGVDLPIMSRLDIRLDPATSATEPDPTGPAVMRGWIRFGDGRPCDTLSLPLFADAFPPSLFSRLGRIGWVPTIELTVHVRARPASGWIQATFETNDLRNGLIVEDGLLWDSSGELVARSRQLAMLL